MKSFRSILALGALLALTGCGSMNIFGASETPPACPRATVVGELARLTEFRPGSGRDLTDVVYNAEVARVDFGCTYDKRVKVTMQTTVNLAIERGPADRDRRADITYFVAVLDPEQRVVARETFTVPVRFDGNFTRMQASEEIEQVITLGGRSGAGYRVYVGFPLTPEQLEFNRARAPAR